MKLRKVYLTVICMVITKFLALLQLILGRYLAQTLMLLSIEICWPDSLPMPLSFLWAFYIPQRHIYLLRTILLHLLAHLQFPRDWKNHHRRHHHHLHQNPSSSSLGVDLFFPVFRLYRTVKLLFVIICKPNKNYYTGKQN